MGRSHSKRVKEPVILVRNIVACNASIATPRQRVREAFGRQRDDNIRPLPATHESRAKGEDSSEEDTLKWISCATWQ